MAAVKKAGDKNQKVNWLYGAVSVLLVVLGVYIIINPEVGVAAICGVIGALALIFGIIKIAVYFSTEIRGIGLSYDLSIGALCAIAGIILLFKPKGVVDLIQVLVGVFLLIDSVLKLQTAVDAKRLGLEGWWVTLIFTLICLALGVVMLLKLGADILMVLVGVALIADGLQNLCIVIFSIIAGRKLAQNDKDGDGLVDIVDVTETQATPEPENIGGESK